MASNLRIFGRLIGLETEYALRFQSPPTATTRPSKFELYTALVGALSRRVLIAEAKHFKDGHFTANGGAVWFETPSFSPEAGLVEGATPECRGPLQLLGYQRAQDRLLAESAAAAHLAGELTLIKNDRDSRGNIYGAQENYEAVIAEGWRLWLWRGGLLALFPLALATWLGLLALIILMVTYFAFAGAVYLFVIPFPAAARIAARLLFGDLNSNRWVPPTWLGGVLWCAERLVTAPLAVGLWLLGYWAAFHRARRRMLAFLISRSVIAGSGLVDDGGHFHLADKAPGLNCQIGYGGFLNDRPIFNFGNIFKTVYSEACLSWREFFGLFARRQRLQIGLGDSNMCESAEYLRIGTTLLVLDAIEAGHLPDAPSFRRPLRTLRKLCADATLQCEVRSTDGRAWTALGIQQFYLNACRRFLDAELHAPPEAYDVLSRWQRVLDAFDSDPGPLVGVIDWVTKKYLLDRAGRNASWESRKKIDLRYHELSPGGYFERLKTTGLVETIVTVDEVERAMRTAPPDTPATTRGHYIREFADSGERLRVNWKYVLVGEGRRTKVIRLANYGRRPAAVERAESPSTPSPQDPTWLDENGPP